MDTQHIFEEKVDLASVRQWLTSLCLSPLGKRLVAVMHVMTQVKQINQHLSCITEMRRLLQLDDAIPISGYHDLHNELQRLRVEGCYLSIEELSHLLSLLSAVRQTLTAVRQTADTLPLTPTLAAMSAHVDGLPHLSRTIESIIDPSGEMRDDASETLYNLRQQIRQEMRSMSGRVQRILTSLQAEKIVGEDAVAVVRDGRLVLAVPSMYRHKVAGVTHGESQGGNLVYIEPQEAVQANFRLQQLQSDERTEIVRILKDCTDEVRQHRETIQQAMRWLSIIDFTRAKALMAETMKGMEPHVENSAVVEWQEAYHPLLRKKREEQGQRCVPLNIQLTSDIPMTVISGPNAGGKSVCLKTVGLLQCMVQCGLSVPMSPSSKVGVFHKMMIDIGDDQSIDDELSTYSSHLRHLKRMIQEGDDRTLLLIDELGGGTEPTAGGAIAEVVLNHLLKKKCRTLVTTHYQNLKLFASTHQGVQNGAMLYDDVNMQPMYELVQGQAGSSFALDIARRVGFPLSLIEEIKSNVGEQYVKQERFLHDVYRDRRYWSNKRKSVAQLEKQLQERIEKYSLKRQRLLDERDNILHQARQEAERLLTDSNKLIESTIRSIRETGAEKEATKAARKNIEEKKHQLLEQPATKAQQNKKYKTAAGKTKTVGEGSTMAPYVGMPVKIRGMGGTGVIESLDATSAIVVTGNMRMRIDRKKLETDFERSHQQPTTLSRNRSSVFVTTSDLTTADYSTTIDLRGMRAEESLEKVELFIDETIVRGMNTVRILHGKGDGILSSVIRKYLSERKEVRSFHDEHVDFGGAGITVVEME